MTKTTLNISCIFLLLIGIFQPIQSQINIKYGSDYIVFEAEDTNTSLNNLWTIRKPGDATYLEYLFYQNSSPDPMNETYLEYTGPWQGAGSTIEYKFTCPKTGTYQVAMRMHSPLRESNNPNKGKWLTPPGETEEVWWELADLRNDFYVKMEGNYTSGSTKHSESDLRTFHKFFGRGANKWGTCINLEHEGNAGLFYSLTEGEEYTFYLKGRSNSAIVDYIAFYDTSYLAHNINNQGPDLAIQLPEEIRPYAIPTDIALNVSTTDLRVGKSLQLQTVMTPINANPNAIWSSSNDAVVTVDDNGNITAQGTIGQTATITAISKLDNTLIATSQVTLVADFNLPVSSIAISPNQIDIVEGDSETLTANVLPTDADNKNVTWSSSDDAIATVDQNGKVTGVSQGSVKITATSDENNTIFGEADIVVGVFIPQEVSINKINGMSIEDFKTARSNKVEIGEVLEMEISYSNITEFNASGVGRVMVRYAINNGGTAVKPNHIIDDVAIGAPKVTQTINYTVADHETGNNSEAAVFQIFVAQNFGGINSLYSGFEVVAQGTLSVSEETLNSAIRLYPNPARNFVTIEKNNVADKLQFSLYNINGAKVMSDIVDTKSKRINTNSLTSGIYIMKLKSDKTIITKKLIIQ